MDTVLLSQESLIRQGDYSNEKFQIFLLFGCVLAVQVGAISWVS